jgi:AcrR family transcriptional regulator
MSLKEEREKKLRAMTREAIREAVISVMAESGQEGLTMQRIAEKAGVAKGTLYLYFNNKEDLLEDTIGWCYKSLVEGLEEIFDADIPPDEKMTQLFDFHHHYFREHQEIFRMLMVERNVDFVNKKEEEDEDENAKRFLQEISDIIQEGIDKGVFKEMNATVVAHIMIESSRGLMLHVLKHGEAGNIDYEEVAGILKEILGKGFLAE